MLKRKVYPAQYNPRVSMKRWDLGKILQEFTIRGNLQIGCGTTILSENFNPKQDIWLEKARDYMTDIEHVEIMQT